MYIKVQIEMASDPDFTEIKCVREDEFFLFLQQLYKKYGKDVIIDMDMFNLYNEVIITIYDDYIEVPHN